MPDTQGLAEAAGRAQEHRVGGPRPEAQAARALDRAPQLVICDEAVSALDVSAQAQAIKTLDRLRREMGLALIFIAHDLPVVRDVAGHVMVMQRNRVVGTGPTRRVFEAPREACTRALLAVGLDPEVQAPRRAERLRAAS